VVAGDSSGAGGQGMMVGQRGGGGNPLGMAGPGQGAGGAPVEQEHSLFAGDLPFEVNDLMLQQTFAERCVDLLAVRCSIVLSPFSPALETHLPLYVFFVPTNNNYYSYYYYYVLYYATAGTPPCEAPRSS
jgi:hypothetical protein